MKIDSIIDYVAGVAALPLWWTSIAGFAYWTTFNTLTEGLL